MDIRLEVAHAGRKLALIAGAVLTLLSGAVSAPKAAAQEVVVAAVGDAACDPLDPLFNSGSGSATACRQQAVGSKIVADSDVDAFLPLGDLQEQCGAYTAFMSAFHPAFGALNAKTYPVPGNHEYHDADNWPTSTCPPPGTPDANLGAGYRQYVSERMPHLPANATNPATGFYEYDLGSWNIIAINTNDMCRVVTCRGPNPNSLPAYAGSPQERWLRDHLSKQQNRCVMVYMHYPRFSSNLAWDRQETADPQDSDVSALVQGIWTDLYEGGAELYLAGHAHNYERFHPLNASGVRDDAYGVRQFVVGTGGVNLETNKANIPGSAARLDPRTFGYLRLTLRNGSFSWGFQDVGASIGTLRDSGSANCHGAPVKVTSPGSGSTITAGGNISVSARVPVPAASNSVDFFIGSKKVATVTKDATTCAASDDIYSDPAVLYTSPYCTYAATASTAGVSGGPQTLRAVANSLDPAVPGATTTGSIAVNVVNTLTRISATTAGTTTTTDLASPTSGAFRDPAYSGSLTKLTYSSAQGIVVANADGSNPQVVPGTVGARSPDFAAGDTRLVYLRDGGVHSIPVAGGSSVTLVSARVAAIAVAGAGGRILYQLKMANGRFDIFVMNANGSGKRNVTRTNASSETQPAWRSKKLVGFARKSSRWAVFTMPVTGGRQTQVTPTKMNCQQPAYSPNGLRLACVTRLTSTRSIIRTMTSRGLSVRTLFTRSVAPSQPVWANNTRVTYTAN